MDQQSLAKIIVTEAETWLNTPWQHQGNIKGRAVDCANFIAACVVVAVRSGAALQEVQEFDIPNNYRRQENGELLLYLLDRHLDYIEKQDRQAGDILALCDANLRNQNIPRHLVIVQSVNRVTTFVIDPTEEGVRRHRLNGAWIRRIHSCWRVRLAQPGPKAT